MGFTVLSYPTFLLSFHKKENYWFPGKGSRTSQGRTGGPGQRQRALSFPTPAWHTHATVPTLIPPDVSVKQRSLSRASELSKVRA